MATPAVQVTPDTLITFKVSLDGSPRRFKLPLRDVGINVLEGKVCLVDELHYLQILSNIFGSFVLP
jgi:hypothetical protein